MPPKKEAYVMLRISGVKGEGLFKIKKYFFPY